MKRTIKTIAIACLASGLMITSCKKEETPAPTPAAPVTKTSLLTGKTWKVTAARYKVNSGAWTDAYSTMTACQKDNVTSFTTANVYTIDEGATKCNSADPQTLNGTWSFQNNESKIVMGYNSQSSTQNITTLNENTMVLTQTDSSSSGVFTGETTYGH